MRAEIRYAPSSLSVWAPIYSLKEMWLWDMERGERDPIAWLLGHAAGQRCSCLKGWRLSQQVVDVTCEQVVPAWNGGRDSGVSGAETIFLVLLLQQHHGWPSTPMECGLLTHKNKDVLSSSKTWFHFLGAQAEYHWCAAFTQIRCDTLYTSPALNDGLLLICVCVSLWKINEKLWKIGFIVLF